MCALFLQFGQTFNLLVRGNLGGIVLKWPMVNDSLFFREANRDIQHFSCVCLNYGYGVTFVSMHKTKI